MTEQKLKIAKTQWIDALRALADNYDAVSHIAHIASHIKYEIEDQLVNGHAPDDVIDKLAGISWRLGVILETEDDIDVLTECSRAMANEVRSHDANAERVSNE